MAKRGLERRYLAAGAVAREAGQFMRRRFLDRGAMSFELKGPQDYLTATDAEAEKLIVERLGEAFPDDTFFGEEGGGHFSPEVWVIDPIDGTANFARGIAHFCVSIAFVREGQIAIGVIYDPMADELFAALSGGGATLNGAAISVSEMRDLRRSVIELGWSTRRPAADYVVMLERVVAAGASFRRSGSGALGLAYVADGRQDGYCELHINSWDALAGILLVREAGGAVNDFLANDGLAQGNPVLAASPGIREALSQATGIAA